MGSQKYLLEILNFSLKTPNQTIHAEKCERQ